VRRFTGRPDGVGDQAERLFGDLTRAAAADESTRGLAAVLVGLQRRVFDILNDAADRVVSLPPERPAEPSTTAPAPAPGNGEPQSVHRLKRISASAVEHELAQAIAEVESEIRAYARHHPGVQIEMTWHVVDEAGA
jgi:hypothetical protein